MPTAPPTATARTGPYRCTSRSARARPSTMQVWYAARPSAAMLCEPCNPLCRYTALQLDVAESAMYMSIMAVPTAMIGGHGMRAAALAGSGATSSAGRNSTGPADRASTTPTPATRPSEATSDQPAFAVTEVMRAPRMPPALQMPWNDASTGRP